MVMISVTTAILTAAGKPVWTFALTGPMVPSALLGHLWLIPRWGALGAALITALFAVCGALATMLAVHRILRVLPPLATLVRSILISGVAFSLAALWPTPRFLLLLKSALIVIFIAFAFLLSSEFRASEIALVRSLFRRQPGTETICRLNNN